MDRAVSRADGIALDPEAGQILRGVMVGLPIGLAMWVMLAFIIWKIV